MAPILLVSDIDTQKYTYIHWYYDVVCEIICFEFKL